MCTCPTMQQQCAVDYNTYPAMQKTKCGCLSDRASEDIMECSHMVIVTHGLMHQTIHKLGLPRLQLKYKQCTARPIVNLQSHGTLCSCDGRYLRPHNQNLECRKEHNINKCLGLKVLDVVVSANPSHCNAVPVGSTPPSHL